MTSERDVRGWALITGASSGIGADLARVFAAEGRDLVLVARTRPALDALAAELATRHGVRVRVVQADLSAPGAAGRLHAALDADGLFVETLVNDAGFGMHGQFVSLDPERQSSMMQLNVVALTELCRLFAPEMGRRARGEILNVASTAAFQPGPLMAVYCATKAYVVSFSAALADELRPAGVAVSCLCPGPTATGFADAAGLPALKLFRASPPMLSIDVAAAGRAALRRRTSVAIPGLRNRLLAGSMRLVPIAAAAGLARRFLETA
ncbi:MAG TPA: SDR family oxidoreductase [Anaeromyxobacter sp.]